MAKLIRNIFSSVIYYLSAFTDLFFPKTCAVCERPLSGNEPGVCSSCFLKFPATGFHTDPENDVYALFRGRVMIEQAAAKYFFYKDTILQKAVHEFKYRGNTRLGVNFGRIVGNELRHTSFVSADMIVPVPLHYKKHKKRGFNQSEILAGGMAESMGKPVGNVLVRKEATESQTERSRYERWKNVEGAFLCKDPEAVRHKHVLLVDDVITTGSTMEACARELLAVEGVKVSVAALAYTVR